MVISMNIIGIIMNICEFVLEEYNYISSPNLNNFIENNSSWDNVAKYVDDARWLMEYSAATIQPSNKKLT
jgi:hypothetical protein